MTRRKKILLGIGVALALFPLPVACGSPQYACAVPGIPGSYDASYYYELEPAGIYLIEWVLPINPSLYYYSYHKSITF